MPEFIVTPVPDGNVFSTFSEAADHAKAKRLAWKSIDCRIAISRLLAVAESPPASVTIRRLDEPGPDNGFMPVTAAELERCDRCGRPKGLCARYAAWRDEKGRSIYLLKSVLRPPPPPMISKPLPSFLKPPKRSLSNVLLYWGGFFVVGALIASFGARVAGWVAGL